MSAPKYLDHELSAGIDYLSDVTSILSNKDVMVSNKDVRRDVKQGRTGAVEGLGSVVPRTKTW